MRYKSVAAASIMMPVLLVLVLGINPPQTSSKGKVADPETNWLSYDQGLQLAKKSNKHVLVDFYTTWCGWCKKMDKETYSSKEVKKLLADNYITVRLNAESSRNLSVDGKDITERQVAQNYNVQGYPTTCFLNSDGVNVGCLPGYIGPEDFVNVLSYIKDKAYEKNMRLEDYIKQKQQTKGKS